MDMDNFVSRLQSVLKERKISQTEIAQELGIRRENFTYWKSNNILPNGDLLIRIADFLNVDVHWLAVGTYFNLEIKEEEQVYLNKFKQLSPRDKNVVSSLCDILLKEKAPLQDAEEPS